MQYYEVHAVDDIKSRFNQLRSKDRISIMELMTIQFSEFPQPVIVEG